MGQEENERRVRKGNSEERMSRQGGKCEASRTQVYSRMDRCNCTYHALQQFIILFRHAGKYKYTHSEIALDIYFVLPDAKYTMINFVSI